jgi:hypothetical protein
VEAEIDKGAISLLYFKPFIYEHPGLVGPLLSENTWLFGITHFEMRLVENLAWDNTYRNFMNVFFSFLPCSPFYVKTVYLGF